MNMLKDGALFPTRTKYERHATKNIENACMFLRVDVSCPWAEKRREGRGIETVRQKMRKESREARQEKERALATRKFEDSKSLTFIVDLAKFQAI